LGVVGQQVTNYGAPTADERVLLGRLRAGDEAAFATVVDAYGASLLRVAMLHVDSSAMAEEVVQDTWIGFLESLGRFEGRSSVRTWLFRILLNQAMKRSRSEGRTVPFPPTWAREAESDEAAVDPDRFRGRHDRWPGHWRTPPKDWGDLPETRLLLDETLEQVRNAIASLPPAQREIITLRDIEGLSAQEVRNILRLTDTNQRVLLHRARSKVRRALERYLDEEA
jgi:RNA polymerase sigma-70 factor (ECF subfamily)